MTAHRAQRQWEQRNQRRLLAELARVRSAVAAASGQPVPVAVPMPPAEADAAPQAAAGTSDGREEAALPLELLAQGLGLSPFERDVLLLCAGVELDAALAACVATARGEPHRVAPTFALALSAFPEAHWSALVPGAPLRRWRLVELGPGDTLTASPLRIDEWALHFLAGVVELDARLRSVAGPVETAALTPAQQAVARQAARQLAPRGNGAALPLVQLCGADPATRRAVAAAACAAAGLTSYRMAAADLASATAERETLLVLWERQTRLTRSAVLLECGEDDGPERLPLAVAFAERFRGPCLVSAPEPLPLAARAGLRLEVTLPSSAERRTLWTQVLGAHGERLDGHLDAVVGQFRMSGAAIRAVGTALRDGGGDDADETPPGEALWDACRAEARPRLAGLARHIRSTARWDNLVLPDAQRQTLREVVAHVRQRTRVYEHWGFAAREQRGLGISALFSGPSGTGKTLAAEVIANELRLDLFCIDLSQVVSKYIGETEKHLRRIFDAAEAGGAILLFDEADALFGKRSEVKDSHDRYANIEVSYLLQRMESYRGLAILTTNNKGALDDAFLRRLRFVVSFPFPDAAQRAAIWRRVFPPQTPLEDVNVDKLARLSVTGGNIRNIALNAAFLAADRGHGVHMRDLRDAAHSECAKLEQAVSAETRDWA